MVDVPRTSIASSSELPYADPVSSKQASLQEVRPPTMYVTGSTETVGNYHDRNGAGQAHLQHNHSNLSLANSQRSRAAINEDNVYRAAGQDTRQQYLNRSQEHLNGHVNFSKPVRPSDASSKPSPAWQTTATPLPSASNPAAARGIPSGIPATPTSAAAQNSKPPPELAPDEHITPDSLLVQKTYARIDEIGGIPGDGFVEGVELTRERRTQASINGYLDPILAASWGPSSSSDRLPEAPPYLSRRKSEGASTSLLSVNDARNRRPGGQTDRSRKVSAASRAASTKTPHEEEEELQLLQKVDRYGFFTPSYLTTTSGRLVLIAKARSLQLPKGSLNSKSKAKARSKMQSSGEAMESPYLHLPPPSPAHTRNNSPRASLQPSSSYAMSASTSLSSLRSGTGSPLAQSVNSQKEPLRILKWYDEMLLPARKDTGGNVIEWKLSNNMIRDRDKLQRRIRKGIPDRWRMAAWEALALHMRNRTRKGPDLTVLGRRFYELILEPCQHDVQIDLDVPRTISGHLYFHTRYGLGQRALFNVLHAFALYCPECGYCQGMGSLAATFLCYMLPEKAYAAMVYLHDSYDMHAVFKPGFPGMLECFHAQEELVKLLMPDVAEVLDKNYISVSSFATKWYITLFVNVLPFSTQLRIWDLFLYGGKDVLILTSTALIWTLAPHITKPSADFETILSLLSSFFVPQDEDAFVRWVGKMLIMYYPKHSTSHTRLYVAYCRPHSICINNIKRSSDEC